MTMAIDNDFLTTGRTGRRNALPDILDQGKHAGAGGFYMSSANLPDQLGSMSFGGGGGSGSDGASGSGKGELRKIWKKFEVLC